VICCLVRDATGGSDSTGALEASPDALESIARACSPRVDPQGDAVLFDASGLSRVLGAPADIAREVRRLAESRGVRIRVALADTAVAAWLLAHWRPGATVVAEGQAASALAELPIPTLATLPATTLGRWASPGSPGQRGGGSARTPGRVRAPARHYRMAPGPRGGSASGAQGTPAPAVRAAPDWTVAELLATFERWGLRTLGEIARLPRADVHARMGPEGVRLHQAASGEDAAPIVPASAAAPFLERCDLEWPIEGLEPLSFVLARLCDELSRSLEQADRGAVTVHTRLRLVTRDTHARALNLPAPMRDPRVLRTLILLDLESHPPPAGIDVVEVECEVVQGRIVQGSLLAHTVPTPENMATLVARLRALMGESRVGTPELIDTHDERVSGLRTGGPSGVQADRRTGRRDPPARAAPRAGEATGGRAPARPGLLTSEAKLGAALGFRRFRMPVAARVIEERGRPVRVVPAVRGLAGGQVVHRAGPWRSSGAWWAFDRSVWDRDEWDVELAGGDCYRLARDRRDGHWLIDGEFD